MCIVEIRKRVDKYFWIMMGRIEVKDFHNLCCFLLGVFMNERHEPGANQEYQQSLARFEYRKKFQSFFRMRVFHGDVQNKCAEAASFRTLNE